MVSYGVPLISGLNEAFRERICWNWRFGSQTNSREAFDWLLNRVDDGDFVIVKDAGLDSPMKHVLRWSTESNPGGSRVPLQSSAVADYTQGRWKADPDLPMLMRLRIDRCLEDARHGNHEPEHLWWRGLLTSRLGGGGGSGATDASPPPPKSSGKKKPPPVKDEPPIAKSEESAQKKAQALFDELANDKNIPFDYPLDCCYARAHEMCRQLEAKGIECGKTWYYPAGWPAGSLSVTGLPKTDIIPDGSLAWSYHVAPTVEVDGKPMVFDPSMFKGPVTPEEWRSKMVDSTSFLGDSKIKDTNSTLFFTGPYGDAYDDDDPDYSETMTRFEEHKNKRDAIKATATETK